MPVGVVLRRRPGVTRWAKWVWQAVGLLPGAGPATWKVLRQEGDVTEYHAATLPIELFRGETEAYRTSLAMTPPSAFVILRPGEGDGPDGMAVHRVTASAYEAQDHTDGGEDQVEPVALPDALIGWVRDFCAAQGEEAPFRKRKRDEKRVDLQSEGVGDARIRQEADVYRAPGAMKPERLP